VFMARQNGHILCVVCRGVIHAGPKEPVACKQENLSELTQNPPRQPLSYHLWVCGMVDWNTLYGGMVVIWVLVLCNLDEIWCILSNLCPGPLLILTFSVYKR